jgi:hypothetical protein
LPALFSPTNTSGFPLGKSTSISFLIDRWPWIESRDTRAIVVVPQVASRWDHLGGQLAHCVLSAYQPASNAGLHITAVKIRGRALVRCVYSARKAHGNDRGQLFGQCGQLGVALKLSEKPLWIW